jgi:hypothetical protein
MKPIDNLRARAFLALNDDLLEGRGFGRTEALRHLVGESLRDRGSRASHGALRSPPSGFDPLSQVSSQEKEAGAQ